MNENSLKRYKKADEAISIPKVSDEYILTVKKNDKTIASVGGLSHREVTVALRSTLNHVLGVKNIKGK